MSVSVLLRIKNISQNVVENLEAHILCSLTFFIESYSLLDNVEKYGTARQATDAIYEGKSLNNRNFIITFLQEYLQKLFVSLFFDVVPLLRNTLGPPIHKLAEAL